MESCSLRAPKTDVFCLSQRAARVLRGLGAPHSLTIAYGHEPSFVWMSPRKLQLARFACQIPKPGKLHILVPRGPLACALQRDLHAAASLQWRLNGKSLPGMDQSESSLRMLLSQARDGLTALVTA